MSVSISTSDYTKKINAEIDGINFVITPMSSAQTIAYVNLCDELANEQKKNNIDRVKQIMEEINNSIFSVFDKPDEARKVLEKVSIDGVFQIYQRIVQEG